MAAPFDQGRAAARRGESRRSNPFDHPDRQPKGSMTWERKASEWDEGFDNYDAVFEAQQRTERARKASLARWAKR
jgi:hypothetical protein